MTSALELLKQQTEVKEAENYQSNIIRLQGAMANFSIVFEGKRLMFANGEYHTTDRALANRILMDYPESIIELKE